MPSNAFATLKSTRRDAGVEEDFKAYNWVPRKTSSAGFSRYPTGRCLLREGLSINDLRYRRSCSLPPNPHPVDVFRGAQLSCGLAMPLIAPVLLSLGRSYRLCAVLLTMHGVAILALIISELPWWWQGSLALPVLFCAYRSLREHGLRSAPDAISAIHLQPQDCWLRLADGRHTTATIQAIGCCRPWLVTLSLLSADGQQRRLVIPGDAVSANDHRRLRQRLLHIQILSDDER